MAARGDVCPCWRGREAFPGDTPGNGPLPGHLSCSPGADPGGTPCSGRQDPTQQAPCSDAGPGCCSRAPQPSWVLHGEPPLAMVTLPAVRQPAPAQPSADHGSSCWNVIGGRIYPGMASFPTRPSRAAAEAFFGLYLALQLLRGLPEFTARLLGFFQLPSQCRQLLLGKIAKKHTWRAPASSVYL